MPETAKGRENSFLLMVSVGSALGSVSGTVHGGGIIWKGLLYPRADRKHRKGSLERVQGKIESSYLHPSDFLLKKVHHPPPLIF